MSAPENKKFVFAYRIRIENMGVQTMQLLSRKWLIYDSNGIVKMVEGDGVIGKQPILKPNDVYEYISGSQLFTEIGKMEGLYFFKNVDTLQVSEVVIPSFILTPSYKLN
jgi:ApaG protein